MKMCYSICVFVPTLLWAWPVFRTTCWAKSRSFTCYMCCRGLECWLTTATRSSTARGWRCPTSPGFLSTTAMLYHFLLSCRTTGRSVDRERIERVLCVPYCVSPWVHLHFCLYCPFNCILFHKFSWWLSVFSLLSSGLISALLVLSTTYISLWKSLYPWYNP